MLNVQNVDPDLMFMFGAYTGRERNVRNAKRFTDGVI